MQRNAYYSIHVISSCTICVDCVHLDEFVASKIQFDCSLLTVSCVVHVGRRYTHFHLNNYIWKSRVPAVRKISIIVLRLQCSASALCVYVMCTKQHAIHRQFYNRILWQLN